MINRHALINILIALGQGDGLWTLHAGGAAVYHLNHRALDEIDLYANKRATHTQVKDDAMRMLARFVPADKLEGIQQNFNQHETGVVKLYFEKVTFSFVVTPKCRSIMQRLSYSGHAYVASLADVAGAKMMGLHDREKLNDYMDMAAIIAKGFHASALIDAFNRMCPAGADLGLIFKKMRDVPDAFKPALSESQIVLLQKTATQGLHQMPDPLLFNEVE